MCFKTQQTAELNSFHHFLLPPFGLPGRFTNFDLGFPPEEEAEEESTLLLSVVCFSALSSEEDGFCVLQPQ